MFWDRDNMLRVVRFERPDFIPMRFSFNKACWHHYPQDALQELMADHPFLFPDFEWSSGEVHPEYAPWRRAGKPYADSWGSIWETKDDGITGVVTQERLASWDDFSNFVPPDPDRHDGWGVIDWEQIAQQIEEARAKGEITRGHLRHGHTFLTLTYIRGYQNVIFDMADENPNFLKLVEMVEAFNLAIVQRYIELGVEWMGYPEDLGMQMGPMLSPTHFRKYIKPVYRHLVAPAREAGCIIHMHSDGDIRALLKDLIDCGIEVINLQDLVNGIDWIKEHLTGRVAVDLDVDRQRITRFGTPAQVDALILEAVKKLGSKDGGLMMKHDMYPGIPLANAKAIMDAMEMYATYYS